MFATELEKAQALVASLEEAFGLSLPELDSAQIALRFSKELETGASLNNLDIIQSFNRLSTDFPALAETEEGEADVIAQINATRDENAELFQPGDLDDGETPVDTPALTEALSELKDANDEVADAAEELNTFLTENEDYTLTEVEASADGVADALEQADAELEAATDARDEFVETTVAGADAQSEGDLATATGLYLGQTARLTDANLQTALDGAQDTIDAEENLYDASGAGTATTIADATEVFQHGEGEAAFYLTAAYDAANDIDAQSELTFEDGALDGAAAADELELAINGVTVSLNGDASTVNSFTANLGGAELTYDSSDGSWGDSDGAVYTYDDTSDAWVDSDSDALTDEALIADLEEATAVTALMTGNVTITDDVVSVAGWVVESATFTPDGGEAIEPETIDTRGAVAFGDDADAGEVEFEDFLAGLEQAGWVAGTVVDGELTGPDGEVSTFTELDDAKTAKDLQDELAAAESALESARNTASDEDLLSGLRAAINAYAGDEGNLSTDAGDAELGQLRTDIITALGEDAADDAVENFIATFADGQNTAEDLLANFTDAANFEPEEEGDEYQPTAAEQSVLNAVAALEERNELITAESNAEAAFDATVEGTQYNVIAQAIEDLATLEQNVADAEQLVTDVTDLTNELTVALEELETAKAWFTDQDLALPVSLSEDRTASEEGDIFLFVEDTEEEGGFTITGFGAEGQDTLYFGSEYALVSLAEQGEEGLEITDRVGDNGTLEIFWAQDGDDLQLFVEADAAAGFDRGDLATDQMTQVTLEGVSFADIDFDGQILTAGVAAEQNVEVA